jgi:hypothetical protein
VGVTIAVYALFLYDARAKEGSWEGLDDAVYYVKVGFIIWESPRTAKITLLFDIQPNYLC